MSRLPWRYGCLPRTQFAKLQGCLLDTVVSSSSIEAPLTHQRVISIVGGGTREHDSHQTMLIVGIRTAPARCENSVRCSARVIEYPRRGTALLETAPGVAFGRRAQTQMLHMRDEQPRAFPL